MKIVPLAVALLLAVALPLAAQTAGMIRIKVVSIVDSLPVPGAQVTLSGPALMRGSRTVLTTERGEAVFLGVPSGGGYSVRLSLEGFQDVTGDIGNVFGGTERDFVGAVLTPVGVRDACALGLIDRNIGSPHRFSLPTLAQPHHFLCI